MQWPDIPPSLVEKAARALCARHYAKRFNKPETDAHVQMNVTGNWQMFVEDARLVVGISIEESAKVADDLGAELELEMEQVHIDEDTGPPRYAALSAYERTATAIRALGEEERGKDVSSVAPDESSQTEVGRLRQLVGDIQRSVALYGESSGSWNCCDRAGEERAREIAKAIDEKISRVLGTGQPSAGEKA